MDFTNLTSFIPTHLAIVIAGIYVLGIFLKNAAIKDKYIPFILMICSITFAVLLTIINTEYKVLFEAIVNGILQGILCWGAAIGVNQLYVQAKKDE